jgi:hypothetical protein
MSRDWMSFHEHVQLHLEKLLPTVIGDIVLIFLPNVDEATQEKISRFLASFVCRQDNPFPFSFCSCDPPIAVVRGYVTCQQCKGTCFIIVHGSLAQLALFLMKEACIEPDVFVSIEYGCEHSKFEVEFVKRSREWKQFQAYIEIELLFPYQPSSTS